MLFRRVFMNFWSVCYFITFIFFPSNAYEGWRSKNSLSRLQSTEGQDAFGRVCGCNWPRETRCHQTKVNKLTMLRYTVYVHAYMRCIQKSLNSHCTQKHSYTYCYCTCKRQLLTCAICLKNHTQLITSILMMFLIMLFTISFIAQLIKLHNHVTCKHRLQVWCLFKPCPLDCFDC